MANRSEQRFEQAATRVSMVSVAGNIILSGLKLLAGILAHSGAMISDAVHSASDMLSSVIVIVGVRVSARESDNSHPYGHERFECVAALALAMILLVTGLFIGHGAIETIRGIDGEEPRTPGVLALIAAVASILVKEGMYQYTMTYARRYDSGALKADAWHHRSDAFSSVGALAGIAGARMGYPLLDPIASLAICAFIVKAAWDIFVEAIGKMVDHACDAETEADIRACVLEQEGVLSVDVLHTRMFASRIYVDLEIGADGSMTLSESHAVAENVHRAIEQRFQRVKHIMVHVNPHGEPH